MKNSLIFLAVLFSLTIHAFPFYERNWKFDSRNAKAWNGASIQEKAMCLNGKSIAYMPFTIQNYAEGRRFMMTADVEGNGEISLGAILIKHTGERKPLQGEAIKLQNERKKLEYILNLTGEGNIQRIAPSIRFNGSFKVYSARIAESPLTNANTPKAVVGFDILRKGTPIPDIEFQGPAQTMSIIQIVNGKTMGITTGKNKVPGCGEAHVLYRASVGGKYTDASRCVFEQKDYDRFQTAASRIKLKKKMSVLFLGDSLTDFCRGYNHLDMTSFWVNKYNPGNFTVTNAAVHGDFLDRIYQRMTGKKGTYKLESYKDLWKKDYDIIFIWIGHNDTVWKKKLSPDKKRAVTFPEKQRTLFSKLFAEIRKHSQAQIVLVTASPMNSKICEMNVKKNKVNFQFAIPELVNEWNANLKKIASENRMYCIDVFPALKNDPLYSKMTTDGVHFSQTGHRAASFIFLSELPKVVKNINQIKEKSK